MPDDEQEKPIPAIFVHAKAVYDIVRDRAISDEDGNLVFKGMISKVYPEAGVPTSQYSKVRALLFDAASEINSTYTPCLITTKDGANAQPSEVVVLREPVLLDLESPRLRDKLLTSAQRAAKLEAETRKQIADLEAEISQVKLALQNHESRLNELESRFGENRREDAKAT